MGCTELTLNKKLQRLKVQLALTFAEISQFANVDVRTVQGSFQNNHLSTTDYVYLRDSMIEVALCQQRGAGHDRLISFNDGVRCGKDARYHNRTVSVGLCYNNHADGKRWTGQFTNYYEGTSEWD